jgi:hypothetical protein
MNKPKTEELVKQFSDFANSFSPDIEGFINVFFRQHRTIQRTMFEIMFSVIEKGASGEVGTDPRNQAAINSCKRMIEGWKKEFIAELVESGWDEQKAIEYAKGDHVKPSNLPMI